MWLRVNWSMFSGPMRDMHSYALWAQSQVSLFSSVGTSWHMIFCHAHLQSGDPKVIKWWHVSRHIATSYALLKSSIGSQKNPHWGELWYGLCRRLPFTTVLTRFIGMIGMNWQKSPKSEGINFGCIPWRVECQKHILIWIEILWFYDF